MKRTVGLFFMAAFFSVSAFAGGNETAGAKMKLIAKEAANVLKEKSCTVTASFQDGDTTTTVTVTYTCSACTQQQACNGAYAILSIVIPD